MTFSAKKRARKRRPRRIGSVTVGTHVSRSEQSTGGSVGSKQVSFSNARKSARARRGMVDQVMPNTRSSESASDYAKRVRRPDYAVTVRRSARVKSLIIVGLLALVVLGLAGTIGAFAYIGSVSDRMALADQSTKAALVLATEDKPQYALFVGEYSEAGKEYSGPSLIILARIDSQTKQVSLISIPTDLQVRLSSGKYGRIAEAQLLGGDAALIKEVSNFAGVSLSHFSKIDKEGFIGLVDSLGGITVDVAEEVDDSAAGSVYIPAGTQDLNGLAALTLSRATNFKTSEERQAENQSKVGIALVRKLLEADAFGLVFTLDGIADKFQSNYSAGDLIALIETFRDLPDENIYATRVPGYLTTNATTGIKYFVADDSAWDSLRLAVDSGQRPSEADSQVNLVDPTSFDVTIRNGSGIAGGAQQLADSLTAAGFQIAEIGNADQNVYEETLVVYKADEMAAAADTLVVQLGIGRAVASNGFYSFESAVLVVVGKDWKPLN